MFLCKGCQKKSLSDLGSTFPFIKSYGPCKLCGPEEGWKDCEDVPSSWEWAWKEEDLDAGSRTSMVEDPA